MLVIRCAECNHAELSANPDCQCGCHVAAIPDPRDTELATLRAELQAAKQTIASQEKTLGGLEQNDAMLRAELATAHARIATLEAERRATAFVHIDRIKAHEITNYDQGKQLEAAQRRIAALEAERDREDIIIEVTIADRENMFICHVRGPVTVDQLLAINDDLFSNCDEQPFLGEPEDIAGVRLKADWVRDGYFDGYWDFTTIARCTYSAEAGEVWTPSDAARAGKAGE